MARFINSGVKRRIGAAIVHEGDRDSVEDGKSYVVSAFRRTLTVRLKPDTTYNCACRVPHCTRSATIGSTRVARRAGITLATNPDAASSADAPTKTIGSSGLTS